MPERAPRNRVVLPQGELRRFKLPEQPLDPPLPRQRRRYGWTLLVLMWAGLSVVCWRWAGLSWGPEQWLLGPPQLDAKADQVRGAALGEDEGSLDDRHPGLDRIHIPAKSLAKPDGIEDVAEVVGAPALSAAEPGLLGQHRGGFESPLRRSIVEDAIDPARTSSIQDPDMSYADREGVAHWSFGCESARKRYGVADGEQVKSEKIAVALRQRRRYSSCKIPTSTALSVCATVIKGRAKGVTVRSEPPNLYVAGCAAAAISRMRFPVTEKAQMVRTEIFWD